MNREIVAGVNWVGFVDWNVRDFHGYVTERGSTYNSYLVRDKETALIDTVKAPYAAELLRNVAELVPLAEIRWVVCNHAEPDHSGSLPAVMAAARSGRAGSRTLMRPTLPDMSRMVASPRRWRGTMPSVPSGEVS